MIAGLPGGPSAAEIGPANGYCECEAEGPLANSSNRIASEPHGKTEPGGFGRQDKPGSPLRG